MKDNITFDINNEELSDLGYCQLSVMICKSNLVNILSFCKEMKIAPNKEFSFQEANVPKCLENWVQGFCYQKLANAENRFTDFCYNGAPHRLYYILKSGKKEAIPVVTDYYTSKLWLTLQGIWMRKKK